MTTNEDFYFADQMFFDKDEAGKTVKKTKRIDCSDGVPEALPAGSICLLTNYKGNISRGRKDKMRGKDVLSLPSDKGAVLIPLNEAEAVATFLFSYAKSLADQV